MVSHSGPTLVVKLPSDFAENERGIQKPRLNGKSVRCTATLVPPTPVPSTLPVSVSVSPQFTGLAAAVNVTAVGARRVRSVRSRPRTVPDGFVATSR